MIRVQGLGVVSCLVRDLLFRQLLVQESQLRAGIFLTVNWRGRKRKVFVFYIDSSIRTNDSDLMLGVR
ncbi:hypothetical protein CSQ79_16555 [Gloeocapsopsis sp. IPPAS B-1203]|nr:hypothetical protein CSQ79_16555 [Gloeocapsopsis sp. IPPAS B-1203]